MGGRGWGRLAGSAEELSRANIRPDRAEMVVTCVREYRDLELVVVRPRQEVVKVSGWRRQSRIEEGSGRRNCVDGREGSR
jgi:hypothetical protein